METYHSEKEHWIGMIVALAAVNSHFQIHVTKTLPLSKWQSNGCRDKRAVNEGQTGKKANATRQNGHRRARNNKKKVKLREKTVTFLS